MSRTRAVAIGKKCLAALQKQKEGYTKQQLYDAILDACEKERLERSALEGLAAWATDNVDKASVQHLDKSGHQMEMFSLDGSYRLGDNERIAVRFAKKYHMLKVLELSTENMNNVIAANDRLRKEYERLEPYLAEKMTKEKAVQAYYRDHPEEEGLSAR